MLEPKCQLICILICVGTVLSWSVQNTIISVVLLGQEGKRRIWDRTICKKVYVGVVVMLGVGGMWCEVDVGGRRVVNVC